MTPYQIRQNAANLVVQAPEVKAKIKDIVAMLESLERCLYWAIDPSESDGGQSWASSLIEHAHMLVDLGHEYRDALKANPPPRDEED